MPSCRQDPLPMYGVHSVCMLTFTSMHSCANARTPAQCPQQCCMHSPHQSVSVHMHLLLNMDGDWVREQSSLSLFFLFPVPLMHAHTHSLSDTLNTVHVQVVCCQSSLTCSVTAWLHMLQAWQAGPEALHSVLSRSAPQLAAAVHAAAERRAQ